MLAKTISFLLDTGFDDLPQTVVDQTQACLMDLVAVAAAAIPLPEVTQVNRYVQRRHPPLADTRPSRLLFSGGRTSAGGAAFANATTLGLFDGHSGHAMARGHAGSAILPVLLAVTDGLQENLRPDGRTFLTLLCIGYEIGIRLGLAQRAATIDRHASGSWNTLACAALTARLLGLSPEQCIRVLGIAEQFAPISPLHSGDGEFSPRMNTSGWGALTGIECAFLVLENRLAAASPVLFGVEDELWEDLGSNWRIMEQFFQLYPVHRWLHGAIEAALEIRSKSRFDPSRVTTIENHIFETAATGIEPLPKSAPEAQSSLSWVIATALLKGQFEPEDLRPRALQDRMTRQLAGLVRNVADDEYTSLFPSELWCRLAVTLDDDTVLTSSPQKPVGDPDNPVSAMSLEAKYTRYATPVLGPTHSRALRAELQSMSQPRHGLEKFLALLLRGL